MVCQEGIEVGSQRNLGAQRLGEIELGKVPLRAEIHVVGA